MEKPRRFSLVTNLKWTTVTSNEVEQAKYRLEATAFNIEAKKAKDDLKKCKYKLKPLTGPNGFTEAYRPGIVKRIFVEKGNGIPMFTPSEIEHINPKPEKFLSKHTKTDLDIWKLKKGEITLTCSGTIGNASYVSNTLAGKCFSQNMIRLIPKEYGGYIYAFIKSKTGQLIIQTNNYGAVIQHIDPEHLDNVFLPDAPNEIKKSIHNKIIKSFELRDKSNELLDEAEQLLIKALKLPPIEKLKPEFYNSGFEVQNYSAPLNQIDERLDGSYHIPIVNSIIDCLLDNTEKILPIGHKEISKAVLHPERFKRVYVAEEDGVPFFGGKGLTSIDRQKIYFINKTLQENARTCLAREYALSFKKRNDW